MPVIAITGSLCSGKSTVLRLLRRKGAVIFNSDDIVHTYYLNKQSLVYRRVKSNFPKAFDKKGRLIRKRLAKIVFSDHNSLQELESIVHPFIIRDLKRWIKEKRRKEGVFVAEVPLLFEKKLETLFDKVILVHTSKRVLCKRIKHRFGLSRYAAEKRLKLFLPFREKKRISDFVIRNDCPKNILKKNIDLIWKELKRG
ncbi:MAG: dephospho-CoA kinase [Candidatus Omnitrophica bacterium]|nr:dephospho-CoA kinase [Candidatus Omnitrophota bacterium]MCM8827363.1 dephospho-CoA kinase [Candidatus Omnitrophota bacterium]